MKPLVTLIALAATVGLSACATTATKSGPTPYQSAAAGKFGFTDQRIEANRYRITFEGNSKTTRQRVEDSLLLRAADVTIDNGYDWFQIAQRATDPKTYSRPQLRSRWAFGGGFGYSSFRTFHPRYGWVSYYDPFWSNGFYDPFFDRFDTEEITRFQATAEIILGKGPKPTDRADAYDARDVKMNLAPRIIPPPAPTVAPAPAAPASASTTTKT